MIKLLKYFSFSVLLFLQFLVSNAEDFGQVEIELRPEIGEIKFYQQGVRLIPFNLKNRSTEKKIVELVVTLRYYKGKRTVSRIVTVAPHGMINTSISLPPFDSFSYNLRVIVNGESFEPQNLRISSSAVTGGNKENSLDILLSDAIKRKRGQLPESAWQNALINSSGYSHHSGSKPLNLIDPYIALSSWPTDSKAYSIFSVILMEQEELEIISERVRESIMDYVLGGGVLVLTSCDDVKYKRKKYGFGFIIKLTDSVEKIASKELYKIKQLANNVDRMGRPKLRITKRTLTSCLPLFKGIKPNLKLLSGLVLVFVLVVLPAVFIVLTIKHKRIYALWLVPVISSTFAFMVLFTQVIYEGGYDRVMRKSIAYIDQSRKVAATQTVEAYFCPLVINKNLSYKSDSYFCFDNPDDYAVNLDIVESGDKMFLGNFLKARTPNCLRINRTCRSLENIKIISHREDELEILNSLNSKIIKLKIVDTNGNVFFTDKPILAGEKGILRTSKIKAISYSSMNELNPYRINKSNLKHFSLNRGEYVAYTENSSFVAKGLSSAKVLDEKSLICGKFAEGDFK